MKSIAIVGAMCFLLIIISELTETPNMLISQSKLVKCQSEADVKSPIVLVSKKLKTKQMPNWQRVIPGMFR